MSFSPKFVHIAKIRLTINSDDATAMFVLAKHYGRAKFAKSFRLFQESSTRGHVGACYEMARLYYLGDWIHGVSQNREIAQHYVLLGKDPKNRHTRFDTPFYNQAKWICDLEKNFHFLLEKEKISKL